MNQESIYNSNASNKEHPPISEKDIISCLDKDGLEYRFRGEQIEIKECPFCEGDLSKPDNQWKLSFNKSSGQCHCFRCEYSGNLVTFKRECGDLGKPIENNAGKKENLKKKEYARDIWNKGFSIEENIAVPAREYLKKTRGLNIKEYPQCLRFSCQKYYGDNKLKDEIFPVLLAAKIVDESGQQNAIHQTYLTKDGNKASVPAERKIYGPYMGGAVRLSESAEILGIAEGLETGMSVYLATGMPIWCGTNAGGMEAIKIPSSVREVFIWGDNDRSERGQNAALKLALRLHRQGKSVRVLIPDEQIPENKKSIDWLDIYGQSPEKVKEALDRSKLWKPPKEIVAPKFRIKKPWPTPLSEIAYHGIAGDYVKEILPHTEADPAGILIQFLNFAGNIFGRNCYLENGLNKFHSNLFTTIVGDTSMGRKGTSLNCVRWFFKNVNENWECKNINSGLSSGEGLIHEVRDKKIKVVDDGKGNDIEEVTAEGVMDKRLLVVEPEFVRVLKASSREHNTLSGILRSKRAIKCGYKKFIQKTIFNIIR